MCEFIADDIDMTTLSQAQKDKLKKDLEDRKKQLEDQARKLGEVIGKIK